MGITLPEAIAAVIRERRLAAGLDARELGRRIGFHYDAIQRLENHPSKCGGYVSTLVDVAAALGMRGSELLALAEQRAAAKATEAA